MVNPVTPYLSLEVPVRGAEVGTWDTPVNGDFTTIDSAFGLVTTVALSTTAVTLATSQAQSSVLKFTGTLTSDILVAINSTSIQKFWILENLIDNSSQYNVFFRNFSGGNSICPPPGEPVDAFSDGTNMKFRNLGRLGSYMDVAGSSTPSWITGCTVPPYLNCDGTAFSSATYPYLRNYLGGTTLPDLRGRVRGYLNQGTGRMNSGSGNVDGNTLFASGGADRVTLIQTDLPLITGSYTRSAVGLDWTTTTFNLNTGATPTIVFASAPSLSTQNVANAGGGNSHANTQPTAIGGITLIRAM